MSFQEIYFAAIKKNQALLEEHRDKGTIDTAEICTIRYKGKELYKPLTPAGKNAYNGNDEAVWLLIDKYNASPTAAALGFVYSQSETRLGNFCKRYQHHPLINEIYECIALGYFVLNDLNNRDKYRAKARNIKQVPIPLSIQSVPPAPAIVSAAPQKTVHQLPQEENFEQRTEESAKEVNLSPKFQSNITLRDLEIPEQRITSFSHEKDLLEDNEQPSVNLTWPIIYGFGIVIGVAAVALAFTVLNAATLGIAGAAVLAWTGITSLIGCGVGLSWKLGFFDSSKEKMDEDYNSELVFK